MSSDQITSISGLFIGSTLVLSAFGLLSIDQSDAIQKALPMIVIGISSIVQGYYTNKK